MKGIYRKAAAEQTNKHATDDCFVHVIGHDAFETLCGHVDTFTVWLDHPGPPNCLSCLGQLNHARHVLTIHERLARRSHHADR